MSSGLSPRLQENCASRILLPQSVISLAILSVVLVCNGCSGNSVAPAAAAPVAAPAAAALTISATLPPGAVDSSYTGSLSASGGTAPYIFSVVSGQLPTGVLLGDSTGTVSGTPSVSGNFTFSVSVSDAKGVTEQKSLQIAVSTAVSNSGSSGGSSGSAGASGGSGSGSSSGSGSTGTSSGSGSNGANSGNSFTALQHTGGWGQYGQRGPNYVDCSPSPCDGISFWMAQNVGSPSMSGQASEFNVGGTGSFADALFNNHLIGPGSTQGMADSNNTIVPSLHDFTYDVYFYGDNMGLSQAVEFDINQFFDNKGFIWGHECRIAGGNEWDVWDNQNARWTPTGVPCYPNSNSWNHLTLKVQRNANDELVYESITLNGKTSNLNWTFGHGSASGWYGLTINYQMDGNVSQTPYNVYLDNLTFSYQ